MNTLMSQIQDAIGLAEQAKLQVYQEPRGTVEALGKLHEARDAITEAFRTLCQMTRCRKTVVDHMTAGSVHMRSCTRNAGHTGPCSSWEGS